MKTYTYGQTVLQTSAEENVIQIALKVPLSALRVTAEVLGRLRGEGPTYPLYNVLRDYLKDLGGEDV